MLSAIIKENSLKSIKKLYSKLHQNKLITDSFWSLFGNIIGRGLSLLSGIIVARYLGKELYGEYGIIKNTILTIAVFSSFGLGYTATKYIAEIKRVSKQKTKQFIRYAINITFMFCLFMSIILFFTAEYLSNFILDAPHLKSALQILSILIIFNGLTTTQIGILSGFGEFKRIAKINSLIGLVTFITSIGLTYFYSLDGALLALLISQIFNWALNYKAITKHSRGKQSKLKRDTALLYEILKFSTPIALQEMTYSVFGFISNIVLIKYASYGDLGMYSVAMQWNALILFIPGILRNVILSHLSENIHNSNVHNKILNTTIKINVLATAIPTIFVVAFSSYIESFYGNSFEGVSTLISISVLITIFTSMSNVYGQAYMSKGYNWTMLSIRLIRDVGVIILFLCFVNYKNASGAKIMVYCTLLSSIMFYFVMALGYRFIERRNSIN